MQALRNLAPTAEPEVSWTMPQVCGTEGLLCICDNPLDMMLKLDAIYGAALAAASSSMVHSTSTSHCVCLEQAMRLARSVVALAGCRWCTGAYVHFFLGILNVLETHGQGHLILDSRAYS